MRFTKKANAEPIPGYRLVEPLGRGGFGEVWKCEAPGGLFKAIKFVEGRSEDDLEEDPAPADEERRAVERIKAIRHPFLLSMDRVESIGGELVIVMELADRNLFNLLEDCKERGLCGIPRDELLGYLREAAEVLDLLHFQYELQHLDIKPQNLFLVGHHIKVADFGLVSSLHAGQQAAQPGAFTPLYAAPETFRGVISRHCDQYSLAVVYQELLTGCLPFRGCNARQLMLQHTQEAPDLRRLPPADCPLLARALAKDPVKRFESCTALIRALRETHPPSRISGPAPAAPRRIPSGPATPSLPGYRFLTRLSNTPTSEVWKAEASDGWLRCVKIVFGSVGPTRQSEHEAAAYLGAVRHPNLLAIDLVQTSPGRMVLATDLVETSLRDRFQECRARGLDGVPRDELLGVLRGAAEALDALAGEHGVLHLGLNPRNLLLRDGQTLIADFGLAHLIWGPAGQPIAQLNARYAAPELFDNEIAPTTDQYSLALIYQEMLTGVLPHNAQARLALAKSRSPCKPGLDLLPACDRDIISRALAWEPAQRWPSCTDMVQAIEAVSPWGPLLHETEPATTPFPGSGDEAVFRLRQAVTEVVATAAATLHLHDGHAVSEQGTGERIRQKYLANMTPEQVARQLEACRRQWNGQGVLVKPRRVVFQVSRPLGFWQRWLGRDAGVELDAHLGVSSVAGSTTTEVHVEIAPYGCGPEHGQQLLNGVAPLLLESLGTLLHATAERRGQDRLRWEQPFDLRFVLPGEELSEPVSCRGKDISLTGLGFYAPPDLPASQARISLPGPSHPEGIVVPASIVRVQRSSQEWYEVGARFLFTPGDVPRGEA